MLHACCHNKSAPATVCYCSADCWDYIDAACMLPQELREPTYTWANPNDWALGINNAAKDNEDTTEKTRFEIPWVPVAISLANNVHASIYIRLYVISLWIVYINVPKIRVFVSFVSRGRLLLVAGNAQHRCHDYSS